MDAAVVTRMRCWGEKARVEKEGHTLSAISAGEESATGSASQAQSFKIGYFNNKGRHRGQK